MRRPLLALTLPLLGLAACTYDRPGDRGPYVPAARITGPAESCVSLTQLRDSRVRDDFTIDFMRDGRRGWRNVLPNRCSGLKSRDSFTYKTSLSQLCSTDIIYVLENYGGSLERGSGCGLGQFVPVELEPRR